MPGREPASEIPLDSGAIASLTIRSMEIKRKVGHPPLVLGETSTSVRVRVPQSLADAIDEMSEKTGETTSTIIRRAVTTELERWRATSPPKRKTKK